MAEYIEREAAKRAVKHIPWCNYSAVGACLDQLPAADVEVVKHGRWFDIVEFNNGERIIATCSNCKDRGELRTDRNEWGFWHINSPRCPNCGCKMDLEVIQWT